MNLLPIALAAILRSSVPSVAFSPSLRSFHASTKLASTALGYRKHSPVIDDVSTSDIVDLSPKHALTTPGIDLSDRVSASTVTKDPLSDPSPGEKKPQFDWFKCWYPVLPVDGLDREKPIPLELLGLKLIVYNDGGVVDEDGTPIGYGSKLGRPKNARRSEGTWRAFADLCPHRKAPLSEGRVEEDGSLLCSYHGWRWNGEGNLTAVPHTSSKTELQRIIDNPKSNCNSFPTQVKNGLLYVWPASGSDARIESALTPLPDVFDAEELGVDKDRIVPSPWMFRKTPVSWDYFYENTMDPAHLEQAHHGITASRYNKPTPFDVAVAKNITKDGFELTFRDKAGSFEFTDKFVAPSSLSIHTALDDDGAQHVIQLLTSPSRPGWCNVIARQTVVKTRDGKVPSSGRKGRDDQIKGLLRLNKLPDFVTHIVTNEFVNQDAFDIILQERHMVESGEYSLAKPEGEKADRMSDAILPTSADKSVLIFRNWIKNFSEGRVPYKGDLALPPMDKATAFDVYSQNTVYHTQCMGALENARKIRFSGALAAAAICFWQPVILGKLGSATLFALFGGASLAANKVIGLLTYIEYDHSKND